MTAVKQTKLAASIVLLEFSTQYELASTFLRFQEHYESRRFHGRTFTLEEYMDWYAHEYGNFTYFQDWGGFNIPSSALTPFYNGKFDPLLKKEERMLDLFRNEKGNFYVIGIERSPQPANDKGLQHEIAHALFHVERSYRNEVQRLLRGYDLSQAKRELFKMGYCRKVLRDEIQAYLISGPSQLSANARKRLAPLSRKLRQVFRRHVRPIQRVLESRK